MSSSSDSENAEPRKPPWPGLKWNVALVLLIACIVVLNVIRESPPDIKVPVTIAFVVLIATYAVYVWIRGILAAGDRFQFRLRTLFLIVTLSCLLLAVWNMTLRPIQEHRRVYRQIEVSLYDLANQRPEGVTKAQWSFVLGWTLQAHGNCCSALDWVDMEHMREFAKELRKRVDEGDVDMSTIDWIWDEYVQFSSMGETYSEKYRPTVPARFQSATATPRWIEVK